MELYNSKYVYFDVDESLVGKKVFYSDDVVQLKRHVNENDCDFHRTLSNCCSDSSSLRFEIEQNGYKNSWRFVYYDPDYEVKKAFMDGKTIQAHVKDNPHDEWFDINKDTLPEGCSLEDFDLRMIEEWKVYVQICGNTPVFNITTSDCVTHCYFRGTYDECHAYCDARKDYPELMYAWEYGKTIQFKSLTSWEDITNPAWETYYEYRIKPIKPKEYVPFDTVQELIDYWDEKHPSNRPSDTLPLIWIKNKKHNYKYLITEFYFDKYFSTDVSTSHSEISLEKLFTEYTFLNGSIIGKVKE